jgi:YjbE family integral membrane protein
MPSLFSPDWWSALAAIIVIDLVLAGDNALVIGLAARNVPAEQQRRVVLWGTFGAIAVRLVLTAVVLWLLRIPGFLLVGGIALVWIGWKLTQGGGEHDAVAPATTMRAAIQTIVVADAVMGVDNVLAVGGAAQGSMLLVVIGLAISVPIVIWGSTLVLKWVDRFPAILWVGAGVLGWTAAKMIASEPLIAPWLDARPLVRTALVALIVAALVALPLWKSLSHVQRAHGAVLGLMIVWVGAFGVLEERMGTRFNLFEHWRWDDELVDLVRWVGWIPLAIPLHRAVGRLRAATGVRRRSVPGHDRGK